MSSTTLPQVLAIGEAMVEFNQTDSSSQHYLQGFGGDTSNAIIACARQGVASGYLTRLGTDEFGDRLLTLWREEGVSTRHVERDATAHTAVYFVHHDEKGHRFSYLRRGSAAARMTPEWLHDEMFAGASRLHVSAISQAISPEARATVSAAMMRARALGLSVSYDPNLRLSLWSLDTARAAVLDTLPVCDIFLPSIEELRALASMDKEADLLAWCYAHGATRVVLKRGAEGVTVSEEGTITRIEPHRVQALDATGAGDCFDGSLLARLALGDSLLQAARYANAAAALATTGYGAVAPLPRPAQVQALLG